MADEVATIQAYWPELCLSAETTAVHETRKAIRRTFTLFKLFSTYFAPGELEGHRSDLRKIMRRLAPCRDLAVFRLKLADYNNKSDRPLAALAVYWDEQQTRADRKLSDYLGRKSVGRRLDRYATLTTTEGAGLPPAGPKIAPLLVRHELPALIARRIGAVRAWGDILPTASPAQVHQLRIQFKELRYTLTFFESLLDGSGVKMIDLSRRIQEHLGDLNDADTAVRLLKDMKDCPVEATIYRAFQEAEIARLMAGFAPLYDEFDRRKVRRDLALVLAGL
jgi:CHAD domain-containing protein